MQKPRILLVDDDPGVVRMLTLSLTRLDRYEVRSEVDATLAMEAVLNFRPHLVILDWIMSREPGNEVSEQIRSDARVAETRILFLTAFIMKRNGPQEIAGYPAIAKPCEVEELVAAIEAQLGHISAQS